MTLFGTIGFASPWLLLGLLALPIFWLLLRAVPPAPLRKRFPAVSLLLGLKDEDQTADKTPWWLLLLRMLAVAAVIVGLAGPILNPDKDTAEGRSDRPILFVLDDGWASASDWPRWIDILAARLAEAGRQGRPAGLLSLANPQPVTMQAADQIAARLAGLTASPWMPTAGGTALPDGAFDTVWLSDGLARDGRSALAEVLADRGRVEVLQSERPVLALRGARSEDGTVHVPVLRSLSGADQTLRVIAHGTDPNGAPAVLGGADAVFAADATLTEATFDLPSELRARITHFAVEGLRSAGTVALADDALRRREVALIAGRDDREGLELLSPTYYLAKALEPTADLLDGGLQDVLKANPDVIVLADVATVTPAEQDGVLDWLDKGGLLLRFAGPRLAASDISRAEEDPLLPVRLRAGGRTVGGAMSWGEPKTLAPFSEDSPFYGLPVPDGVTVTAQVMAQPDPTLAERVIAQLADGTPLVTRKTVGQGQVVLVHVTANAEWSSLALSGLFVQMLDRLAATTAGASADLEGLEGTVWAPLRVLDGFGRLTNAEDLPGVAGPDLFTAPLGVELQPGIYQSDRSIAARNVLAQDDVLTPADWPSNVAVSGLTRPEERPLDGAFLAAALILLALDVIASLHVSGKLLGHAAALALAVLIAAPHPAQAQSDAAAIEATSELRLAHVLTGNGQVDDLAQAGLWGLSETLFFRTSVEPGDPVGVDLEADELAFYPLLYWPITPDQPTPSDAAYAKLNQFLRTGGMILFDTRDADIAQFGTASPNGRKLQQLAAPLNIPALEPVPQDHVLTRTFYLVQDFPGRFSQGTIWVEAAAPDAEQIEGMPFRNLNDNVTPVVIGGNDWAAAWAMDELGNPLVPIGRGMSGERQREIANRFGVNLVMHVLTGNYKSDQVHVPALLERLGQ
ncbi:DUF4159 domain-containing protein [Pseudoprimorskyibacter insulae]|uniref:LytTR family transcriptional regulator n=1 Tax=Pseudoprimorskyibacter insulae TaxID=1695997 RepID=A0A2R8AYW5_9RHOB|nr:DUF4159 domain-containing protein [Pseudoprimorskyibacter insulae]SPF81235.1 hypothetical protein PRI8871_03057 [Pseudoprimorskyibacter insulae]